MSLLGNIAYKISEAYYDWKLGIRTGGLVMPNDFGAQSEGCHAYLAMSYRVLFQILQEAKIRPNQDVFIDFGSGMGRVPLAAGLSPYKKVIGVELSKSLNDIAIINAKNAKPKLICQNIEMVESDARTFPIPADASVIFFFMPFGAEILAQVLDKIHESAKSYPRTIQILYTFPAGGINLHSLAKMPDWLYIEEEKSFKSLQFMRATISA